MNPETTIAIVALCGTAVGAVGRTIVSLRNTAASERIAKQALENCPTSKRAEILEAAATFAHHIGGASSHERTRLSPRQTTEQHTLASGNDLGRVHGDGGEGAVAER